MKKYFPAQFFIFLFSVCIFSQTPTPPPVEDDEIVKISTSVIQLDVTVTDKKGTPISDLKPENFEIYENGEKQKITGFSFISNRKNPSPRTENSDRVRPEQIRRTIALVVDDLSLSFESIAFVRRSLKKFVDEQMQTGDLVAIVRTGSGVGALQQFTTDKRRLYDAIEKVRWNPRGTGQVGAFNPVEPIDPEVANRNLNPLADQDFIVEKNDAQRGSAETDFYNYRESFFVSGTLGALDYIIRGMRDLPGRKSVMLMSDGFRIYSKKLRGEVQYRRILDSLRRLTDLANRSSVVIYTIDARGLQTGTLTAQDNTLKTGEITLLSSNPDPTPVRISQMQNTQDGLIYLARETGGISFLDNNDLNLGIRRMLEDQSYYLIAYEPDAETFDPKKRQFNEIKITVDQKDAAVRYRSGFFGVSDEKIAEQISNLSAEQQLTKAIVSPFTTNSIAVQLNTVFGNEKDSGSYVRSLVHIDTKDLQLTDQADGTKKAVFDVLAASFGDNGTLIDRIGTTYTLTITKEALDKFIREGFVYYFTYPVKKPGVYQYRVAVRDGNSKQIGSATQLIEVPDLDNDRLTISGVILENLTQEQWQNRLENKPAGGEPSNPLADTSLRRFKTGTLVRYGFEIYNAKLDKTKKPDLSVQIRLLRDGEVILDGRQNPVEIYPQTGPGKIPYAGGFNLGDTLPAGNYILRISVTDNLANQKRNTAVQFIQFEIVK